MTLDARDSKPMQTTAWLKTWEKRSRLVTIESWLTVTGRMKETYNRHEMIELIDEFEQTVNKHNIELNERLMKIVQDFNNVAMTPKLVYDLWPRTTTVAVDLAHRPGLLTRLWDAIYRRFNAIMRRH